MPFGNLVDPEFQSTSNLPKEVTAENLDWALIEIDDTSMIKPNLFTSVRNKQGGLPVFRTLNPARLQVNTPHIQIDFLLGGRKCCYGVMSTVPTFLLIPPGSDFAQVYTVKIASCFGEHLSGHLRRLDETDRSRSRAW
jgi:hypothetical protein